MNSPAHKKAARAWQRRQRQAGRCVLCGDKAVTADYCEEHRQKVNAQRKKRQAALYARRKLAGECVQCGLPSNTTYCVGCLSKRSAA